MLNSGHVRSDPAPDPGRSRILSPTGASDQGAPPVPHRPQGQTTDKPHRVSSANGHPVSPTGSTRQSDHLPVPTGSVRRNSFRCQSSPAETLPKHTARNQDRFSRRKTPDPAPNPVRSEICQLSQLTASCPGPAMPFSSSHGHLSLETASRKTACTVSRPGQFLPARIRPGRHLQTGNCFRIPVRNLQICDRCPEARMRHSGSGDPGSSGAPEPLLRLMKSQSRPLSGSEECYGATVPGGTRQPGASG